jgi:hypothetical protein
MSERAGRSSGADDMGACDELEKADDGPGADVDEQGDSVPANTPPQPLPFEVAHDGFEILHVSCTPALGRDVPGSRGLSSALNFSGRTQNIGLAADGR